MSPAYPSKKPARPLLTTDGRRVLELLVGSARQGCTEAFLLAHGFTVDLLADMVRAGFATAQIERVRAGGQPIEVTRVHITDAGRRALKGKRTQSLVGAFAPVLRVVNNGGRPKGSLKRPPQVARTLPPRFHPFRIAGRRTGSRL